MTTLTPVPDWRRAFKLGMRGTDVAALQINLPGRLLEVDGVFGPKTESVVKSVQEKSGLVVDGIAGADTQKHLVRVASGPIQKELKLPGGILVSISHNESGFYVAAYAGHYGDPGYDLGPFQRNLTNPTQEQIRNAYSAAYMARWTGQRLRATRDRFSDPWPVDSWYVDNVGHGKKGHMAWQLAVLTHNWPEAAENIWRRGSIHKDPAIDTQDSDWVIYFSGGRLRSDREWVCSYIERATVYVRWP